MNKNELYLTLMALPAFIMLMTFLVGMSVVVLTDNDKLMERIAKALAVVCIIGGLWETAMITYVAIIKLIN